MSGSSVGSTDTLVDTSRSDSAKRSRTSLWRATEATGGALECVRGVNPLSTGQSKIGRRRPIKLNNHCVFISQRISTNKISLERSVPYLNVDTLFLKIGQETTPLQLFEVT